MVHRKNTGSSAGVAGAPSQDIVLFVVEVSMLELFSFIDCGFGSWSLIEGGFWSSLEFDFGPRSCVMFDSLRANCGFWAI